MENSDEDRLETGPKVHPHLPCDAAVEEGGQKFGAVHRWKCCRIVEESHISRMVRFVIVERDEGHEREELLCRTQHDS